MKKSISIAVLFGCLQFLVVSTDAGTKPPQEKRWQKPMIGYIKNEDLVDLCGCSFEHITRERGYTFASDPENKTTWMNIDGIDVNLKLTHFSGSKRHRIGSRYLEIFEAEGVKAVLQKVVTRLCVPYGPECETTGYDVTITVTRGNRRQTVKAKGQCGCV